MNRWICLISFIVSQLFLVSVTFAQETGHGYLKGTILTSSEEALSDGRVLFFDVNSGPSPYESEYWRNHDYAVWTKSDGSFSVELPQGTYYLIVIKKTAGEKSAYPREGDLIYPPKDGRDLKPHVVKAGDTKDMGPIIGAVPFKKEWTAEAKTGIQGTVFDKNGQPVEGKLVIASLNPEVKRPYFISDSRTGNVGKYIIRVPEGGDYYLRVKGFSQPIVAVAVAAGEITGGIDIHLSE